MPAAVQNPRYQEVLKRLFGLKESRAFDIEDILLPVAPLFTGSEDDLAFLRGERLASGTSDNGAVAAQYGFGVLENPVNSQGLIVVDSVTNHNGTNVMYGLIQSTGLGASKGAVKTPRDGRRWGLGSVLFGDVRGGTDVNAPGAGTGIVRWALGTLAIFKLGWVIPPGWSLIGKNNVQNALCTISFDWRERPVEATEL